MREFIHHPECRELSDRLYPLAATIEDSPPHWIVTPDGDLGTEWCAECGHYKVRNLRRHDRKRSAEYILDGGWVTEQESLKYCSGCGKHLRVSLLKYGCIEELEYWESSGFGHRVDEDAYALVALLDGLEVTTEEDEHLAIAAIEIGRRFASQALSDQQVKL